MQLYTYWTVLQKMKPTERHLKCSTSFPRTVADTYADTVKAGGTIERVEKKTRENSTAQRFAPSVFGWIGGPTLVARDSVWKQTLALAARLGSVQFSSVFGIAIERKCKLPCRLWIFGIDGSMEERFYLCCCIASNQSIRATLLLIALPFYFVFLLT